MTEQDYYFNTETDEYKKARSHVAELVASRPSEPLRRSKTTADEWAGVILGIAAWTLIAGLVLVGIFVDSPTDDGATACYDTNGTC